MTDSTQQAVQQTPAPTSKKIKLIDEARQIINGANNLPISELECKYKELEKNSQFAYATEVLLKKMQKLKEQSIKVPLEDYQKLALYIYKDHSLPSTFKFNRAIQELKTHDDIAITDNCESLGLMGAIYKRIWQFDQQFKNLILSRFYYRRGYLSWQQFLQKAIQSPKDPQNDDGFTAINYAYINELMAVEKLEEHGQVTGATQSIQERQLEAEEVRIFIIKQFVDDPFGNPSLKNAGACKWVLSTLAEAYFGLRKYNLALKFINDYLATPNIQAWEIKTFNQQMLSCAYLQTTQLNFYNTYQSTNYKPAYKICDPINTGGISQCVNAFITGTPGAVAPIIKKGGKLGLALSGGGFRAALFHIGVLAALAEKDELKNVEVLSCVSGGSIIGAFYYIKLKQLLEAKTDKEIANEKDCYIKIVQEIEKEFLKGVQKNLRVRIFSNISCNFKMLLNKKYSRTHRLGELYEEHLFKKLFHKKDGIYISELSIEPKDFGKNFDISIHNWQRENKVPQLVLNATSVNTGHNWQFTSTWMGEPPGNIQTDIDVKPRLRRMYYEEAPEEYKKFRLGYAVGASSCVPVMFHPMPMFDLYPNIDLQLVDGGLHDNQGIAALIEQECLNMIISDASGQLPTTKVAAGNEATLFFRTDNILQERLRELQFMDIKERDYTSQLNQLLKMHLKSDLQEKPVSWKDCDDPERSLVYGDLYKNKLTTDYGVLKDVQTKLSNLRTDLDSFSDAEAYALMYSAYLQTHYEWNKKNQSNASTMREDLWKFSDIKDHLQIPSKSKEIEKVLDRGKDLFFKVIWLNKAVKYTLALLLTTVSIFVLYFLYKNRNEHFIDITIKGAFFLILLYWLGRVFKGVGFLLHFGSEIKKWLLLFGLAIFGWLVSNIYIGVLNRLYNKAGKLKKTE